MTASCSLRAGRTDKDSDMLQRIFKEFEFKALGIGLIVCRWDVEVSVGPLAVAAMWGRMPITGMFLRAGERELHLEWPFRVCGGLTSGRTPSRAT
ncbi:hypothetical protein Maq22A_c26425 [Methylobacterium aquaticum]|uniref:Uncharacterized protein n=2 Tax=Methylobacterium aquaticum TaxID=270351 RepID=A0A0C6FXT5_9HYPH|nr:hypothetical protein Maq22A_c26425 [Methylobacterium aquaticum]